jgi:hypothetical protein
LAASKNLSSEQRKLRASIASHESWARTENRTARSQHGRDAFRKSFEDDPERGVDPEHKLKPAERAKRAENAFKAHMARLAFSRSKKTEKAKQNGDGP